MLASAVTQSNDENIFSYKNKSSIIDNKNNTNKTLNIFKNIDNKVKTLNVTSNVSKINQIDKNNSKETYIRQENNGISTYMFNTGEVLELKISNNIIDKDNAIYTTNAIGDYIVFAGEKYERLMPDKVMFLAPITNSITNKTLMTNETLKLKGNYSFVIYEINNREFKSKILKNNKVVRDSIINRNTSLQNIGLWKEINEYRRQKILWIDIVEINDKDVLVTITQYGDKKDLYLGTKFGEFQIANMTDNSITMKNFQSIKTETGKELSLMNNKIKINI